MLGTLLRAVKKYKNYKILILPDHPTPVSLRTHTRGEVPFLIYRSCKKLNNGKIRVSGFDEKNARKSKLCFTEGYRLMKFFLKI